MLHLQGLRVGAANTCGVQDSHHIREHCTGTVVATTSQVGKCVRQVALNPESATFVLALFLTRRNSLREQGQAALGHYVQRDAHGLLDDPQLCFGSEQVAPASLTTDGRCP